MKIENIRHEKDSEYNGKYKVTNHALQRMAERKFNKETLEDIMACGKVIQNGSAYKFVIDNHTINLIKMEYGYSLKKYHGVVVICYKNKVMTIFRDTTILIKDRKRRKAKVYNYVKREEIILEVMYG